MHNYYNGKRLPEYYDTMYLDGYSGDEMQEKQRREIELEKELEQQVEEKLEKTLNKALDELLKGFK